MDPMAYEVRRAATRMTTSADGLVSRHSFSFGPHYDPDDVRHALLVAHNEDTIEGGHGYAEHPHRNVEILTWVFQGGLRHQDTRGHVGLVTPGRLQRLSAGAGVRHAEHHDPESGPVVRLVQMWIPPDEPGGEPDYAERDVGKDLFGDALVAVASGRPRDRADVALTLANRDATLHVGRLGPGTAVLLPDAPYLHLFVGSGAADLEAAGALVEGDAVRLAGAGSARLTAGPAGCEVLVWEMHRSR